MEVMAISSGYWEDAGPLLALHASTTYKQTAKQKDNLRTDVKRRIYL